MNKIKRFFIITCAFLLFINCQVLLEVVPINAKNSMPFYNLKPDEIVCRATFFTSYSTSSDERKNNILLATKALNNTIVDVNGEFSFNQTVGARTEKRGYKIAKIIVGGEFVDGVGGGVCQVSTTLYNAILLAGLTITEYHPHSLPVKYVEPSFDAMVNSGTSDLRFINKTDNPIIIKASADGKTVRIEILGQPMQETYTRHSIITEQIPAPPEQESIDEKGEFADLYIGERKIIKYSSQGYKSEGYLVKLRGGIPIGSTKIRSDIYKPMRGLVVIGNTERPIEESSENIEQKQIENE